MSTPWIDATFRLAGSSLPLDHGYSLFGAVSRLVPELHQDRSIGIHPVRGRRSGPGVLSLSAQSSLTVRLPIDDVKSLLPLVGVSLEVDGHSIKLGALQLNPLVPWPRLRSRFVTIKGFHAEPEAFEGALRKQLRALGSWADTVAVEVGARRVAKISSHTVVGFAVVIDGLTADASTTLQVSGLGGRRHMGAGIFVPTSRRA